MSFTDFGFYPAVACLLLLLVLLQIILKNRGTVSNSVRKIVLLVFGYVLMYLYDYRFCICITGVILLTWVLGIMIGGNTGKRKNRLTALAVTGLLLVLGIFKYLNFFTSTAMTLVGRSWDPLHLILPLGISFYIFSAVGYILDVSWENTSAEHSILDMALFLSFFPKQICGPIVKGRDFLPQLKENRRITWGNFETGAQVFVFGLFKKIVLADHLAVFVDGVFDVPAAYGTGTVWLAVFSYFLQLYLDFSGYSDMAVGFSKILGYDLPQNFNLPFTAHNISEFWDRWHISLSSWLNEYLFNPIALKMKRTVAGWPAQKRKKYRMLPTYTAILITFLISGLWHGAGFTFIIWGGLQGIFSVIHAYYADRMKKYYKKTGRNRSKMLRTIDVFTTYFLLSLIQVFFRAESVGQAFYILKRMFIPVAGIEQPYTWTFFAYILLITATLAAYRRQKKAGESVIRGFYPVMDLDTVFGLTVFFTASGLTIMLAYFGQTYFIYGKF